MNDDARHLLCAQSLDDERPLFRYDLQAGILGYDLACGDFNADGAPDSIVRAQSLEWDRDQAAYYESLRIVSGKDGALIWEKATEIGGYGWSGGDAGVDLQALTATNAGDVNGDGVDDLASLTEETEWREYGGTLRQRRLEVFDVVHNTMLKDIAITPLLRDSSGAVVDGGMDETMLVTDVDADGRGVVIMSVGEPSLPTYDPDASSDFYGTSSPQYMVLVDLESGRRLCAFTGFDPASVSVLPSQQPGILALAACGGLCFLRLDAELQVNSPQDGSSTGPTVGVSWESPSEGGSSQVFVDGVRNDITNGSKSDLYLGRGAHQIVVRSVDDCGRISYGPSDLDAPVTIVVAASPWRPVWLVLVLAALLAVVLALFYHRLHRAWRARRLPRGGSNGH